MEFCSYLEYYTATENHFFPYELLVLHNGINDFHQPPLSPSAIIVEAVVEKPSLSALVPCSHRNHFVLFTALTHKKDIPSLKTGNTSAMFFLRCLLLKQ